MSRLPSEPVLVAAGRWIRQLEHSGIARAQAVFGAHLEFLDLTPTQYGTALGWLRDLGLVTEEGRLAGSSALTRFKLLEAAVLEAEPLWLRDADQLVATAAEVPDQLLAYGAALGLAPHEILAVTRSASGKVDTAARAAIGAAGEAALVRILRTVPGLMVEHVAEYADGLGYDIAVNGRALRLHLEVKATTRRGRLTVYLSRNEFEVMRHDSCWRLVVLHLDSAHQATAVGTVDSSWIASQSPSDTSPHARWESMRLDIPPGVAHPGLPDLADCGLEPGVPPLGRSTAGGPDWLGRQDGPARHRGVWGDEA